MPRETLTRLMTGIFIAQVAVKLATDLSMYDRSLRYWREHVIDALETTIIKDAFYMPAAVALMRYYQS